MLEKRTDTSMDAEAAEGDAPGERVVVGVLHAEGVTDCVADSEGV